LKILILDGSYEDKYSAGLERLVKLYESKEHKVEVLNLEKMRIAYCTGCWSCWVKTPGKCVHNDDTQVLLRKTINSDAVIVFTENSFGYTTSLTKKAQDKMVSLIHPYIELVQGESHHKKRYEKYPKFGLIFIDEDMNENDFDTVEAIYKRVVINLKTELAMSYHTKDGMEGLTYENISI